MNREKPQAAGSRLEQPEVVKLSENPVAPASLGDPRVAGGAVRGERNDRPTRGRRGPRPSLETPSAAGRSRRARRWQRTSA